MKCPKEKMRKKMKSIEELIGDAKRIAITGHVSPDGDCMGSCLGLWNYLTDNYPDITAHVYLQQPREDLMFMPGADGIKTKWEGERYDLLILLDISTLTRVDSGRELIAITEKKICFDHHFTNKGEGFDWIDNDPDASSASEVIFRYLDNDKISKNCATCLYTGIVHDTGVFQYQATSPDTMRAAAVLMEKGVDFTKIIDESFFQRSFIQAKILGEVLETAELICGGNLVVSQLSRSRRFKFGVKTADLDGVVGELRNTKEADTAMFIYQLDDGAWKVSLRSRNIVDVSAVCAKFGGGGHIRASGCRFDCDVEELKRLVIPEIEKQLKDAGVL